MSRWAEDLAVRFQKATVGDSSDDQRFTFMGLVEEAFEPILEATGGGDPQEALEAIRDTAVRFESLVGQLKDANAKVAVARGEIDQLRKANERLLQRLDDAADVEPTASFVVKLGPFELVRIDATLDG